VSKSKPPITDLLHQKIPLYTEFANSCFERTLKRIVKAKQVRVLGYNVFSRMLL